MNRLLHAFWYARRTAHVRPLPVNFPSGTLRFVFRNVEVAPTMILWLPGFIASLCFPKAASVSNEIEVNVDRPVVAMSVAEAQPGTTIEVFQGNVPLTFGPIPASVCDMSRTYDYFVPRWRLALEWLGQLFGEREEDY